jgi:hypothetical protein
MKGFIKIFAKTHSSDIILNILYIIYNSIALKKRKNLVMNNQNIPELRITNISSNAKRCRNLVKKHSIGENKV